jgi:hypothetical protein
LGDNYRKAVPYLWLAVNQTLLKLHVLKRYRKGFWGIQKQRHGGGIEGFKIAEKKWIKAINLYDFLILFFIRNENIKSVFLFHCQSRIAEVFKLFQDLPVLFSAFNSFSISSRLFINRK